MFGDIASKTICQKSPEQSGLSNVSLTRVLKLRKRWFHHLKESILYLEYLFLLHIQ